MTGMVTAVKRFAVHDGDGIRTTVFLKGCPLRCRWCHNPESLFRVPQISFLEEKCIGCGQCAAVCPAGAHILSVNGHAFLREQCTHCGACAAQCPTRALLLYGREMAVEEVLRIVCEDRIFYGKRGGMTLSGGEPTAQAPFALELLEAAKTEKLNTALDTCGYAPHAVFEKLLPLVDCFLFDIKHIDAARHRALTGCLNGQILDNYRFLAESGARLEVRIPLIPGENDDEETLDGIGTFLREAPPRCVRLLPYHGMAAGKYAALDMPYPGTVYRPPDGEGVQAAARRLRRCGLTVRTD